MIGMLFGIDKLSLLNNLYIPVVYPNQMEPMANN